MCIRDSFGGGAAHEGLHSQPPGPHFASSPAGQLGGASRLQRSSGSERYMPVPVPTCTQTAMMTALAISQGSKSRYIEPIVYFFWGFAVGWGAAVDWGLAAGSSSSSGWTIRLRLVTPARRAAATTRATTA